MRRFLLLGLFVGFAILYSLVRFDDRPEGAAAIVEPAPVVERVNYRSAQPRAAGLALPRDSASYGEKDWLALADRELELRREEWQLAGYHDFKGEVSGDPLGKTVNYRVYQDGVPVADTYIQMRFTNSGELESIDNRYQRVKYINVAELASREETFDIYQTTPSSKRFALFKKQDTGSALIFAGDDLEAQLVYPAQAIDTERDNHPVTVFLRAGDSQVIRLMYPRQEIPTRYSHGR